MPSRGLSSCLVALVATWALATTSYAFLMPPSSSPSQRTTTTTSSYNYHHHQWALSAKRKNSRDKERQNRKRPSSTPPPPPASPPPSQPVAAAVAPPAPEPAPVQNPPQPVMEEEMVPPPAPEASSPPMTQEADVAPPVPIDGGAQEIDYAAAVMKRFGADWEKEEPKYPADWLEVQKILQGKINVYGRRPRMWDPISMLPVPPRVKLRQFWPQADDNMKTKYRLVLANDLEVVADEIMARFRPGSENWEELRGFYLANRDWLGQRVKALLSARKLRAVADNRMDVAKEIHEVMKVYIKVELSVMCHFKQAVRDAEVRLARNIGKFDAGRFAGNTASEISAMWIILKGILAVWENRREEMSSDPATDPRALSGTGKVVTMFQRMNIAFSEDQSLIDALPSELQFLDRALGEASGTELRRWAIREFCPSQGWQLEELRERIRLVIRSLESLFVEDVGVLHKKLMEVHQALALGTAEVELESFAEIFNRTVPVYTDRHPPFTIDAAFQMQDPNNTVARDPNELFEYAIKAVGVPFPESDVERLTPLYPPANPFLDRMVLLDDHDTSKLGDDYLPPAEVMARAGDVTQAQIDRILRNTVPSYMAGSPEEAESMKGEENRVWAYLNMIQDMTPEERAEHYKVLAKEVEKVELTITGAPADPNNKPPFRLLEEATAELERRNQELFAQYKATLSPEEVERFEARMKKLKRSS